MSLGIEQPEVNDWTPRREAFCNAFVGCKAYVGSLVVEQLFETERATRRIGAVT